MGRFFICCGKSDASPCFRRLTTRPVDAPEKNDDMYSADDGFGRNQSFMSIDSAEELAPVNSSAAIGHGQQLMRSLKCIVSDKIGFVSSGSIGETQLWYLPKSSNLLPMMVMGQIVIPGSNFDLVSVINLIMNLNFRTEWDPEFLEGQLVYPIYNVNECMHLRTSWIACKSKPGFPGRDFVIYSFSEVSSTTASIVTWSVPPEYVPPSFASKVKSPAHVRARIISAGYYLDQSAGSLTITYINQADLGVSAWLSEPAFRKMPKVLNTLKQYIVKTI